jgi:hypothetical protein
MRFRRSAGMSTAFPAAVLLSLIVAGPALAVTWEAPVVIARGTHGGPAELVSLDRSTVVTAFTKGRGPAVRVKRSVDSGATWGSSVTISGVGDLPAIAGRGSNVDVVWRQNSRVYYARSTDGGASFSRPRPISATWQMASEPAVARGPGGSVAIVWEDEETGRIRVRVSGDGGTSFGSAVILSTRSRLIGHAVAIGRGVIYVAYHEGNSLLLKRSLDSGTTWSAPTAIADESAGWLTITAAGTHAYVASTVINTYPNWWKVVYRRTTDSGVTWSPLMDLSPAAWTGYGAHIALQRGIVRAVFQRCLPVESGCVDTRTYYRQSSDGTSWTALEEIPPEDLGGSPVGIAFADKVLVLYAAFGPIYVRRGMV